jgi:hypothetical protein
LKGYFPKKSPIFHAVDKTTNTMNTLLSTLLKKCTCLPSASELQCPLVSEISNKEPSDCDFDKQDDDQLLATCRSILLLCDTIGCEKDKLDIPKKFIYRLSYRKLILHQKLFETINNDVIFVTLEYQIDQYHDWEMSLSQYICWNLATIWKLEHEYATITQKENPPNKIVINSLVDYVMKVYQALNILWQTNIIFKNLEEKPDFQITDDEYDNDNAMIEEVFHLFFQVLSYVKRRFNDSSSASLLGVHAYVNTLVHLVQNCSECLCQYVKCKYGENIKTRKTSTGPYLDERKRCCRLLITLIQLMQKYEKHVNVNFAELDGQEINSSSTTVAGADESQVVGYGNKVTPWECCFHMIKNISYVLQRLIFHQKERLAFIFEVVEQQTQWLRQSMQCCVEGTKVDDAIREDEFWLLLYVSDGLQDINRKIHKEVVKVFSMATLVSEKDKVIRFYQTYSQSKMDLKLFHPIQSVCYHSIMKLIKHIIVLDSVAHSDVRPLGENTFKETSVVALKWWVDQLFDVMTSIEMDIHASLESSKVLLIHTLTQWIEVGTMLITLARESKHHDMSNVTLLLDEIDGYKGSMKAIELLTRFHSILCSRSHGDICQWLLGSSTTIQHDQAMTLSEKEEASWLKDVNAFPLARSQIKDFKLHFQKKLHTSEKLRTIKLIPQNSIATLLFADNL